MQDDELLRYSRHILLEDIGIEGQEKILGAHALVIGAGGLGSPVAMYLAAAGIGALTVADHDTVDLTNLQRQIAHSTASIGQSKTASLERAVHSLNPGVRFTAVPVRADAARLDTLVVGADIVLDCSDNFETRHAVNAACVKHRKPLVSGAAIQMDGQISVYDSTDEQAPCYACVFPPDATFEEARCATMGVFAPLVGIIGTMQAAEALKVIVGVGRTLKGRLLMLDGRGMEFQEIAVPRNPRCPVCAGLRTC